MPAVQRLAFFSVLGRGGLRARRVPMVEFEVNVPDGAQASEIEARNLAEASAAARLVDE